MVFSSLNFSTFSRTPSNEGESLPVRISPTIKLFRTQIKKMDDQFNSATRACNYLSCIPIVSTYSGTMRLSMGAVQTLSGVASLGVHYFSNIENPEPNKTAGLNGEENIYRGLANIGRGLVDISRMRYPIKLLICCLSYMYSNSEYEIDNIKKVKVSDINKGLATSYHSTKEGLESLAVISKVFGYVPVVGAVFALPLLTMVGTFQLVIGVAEKTTEVAQKVLLKTSPKEGTVKEKNLVKEGAYNIVRGVSGNLPIISYIVAPVFLAHDIGLFIDPKATNAITSQASDYVMSKIHLLPEMVRGG